MSDVCASFGVPWPPLNDGILYNDVVPPSFQGCSVLDFYCAKYKNSAPMEGWQRRIENGQITSNGEVVKAIDAVVKPGDCITYHRLPWNEPPAPWKLEVLYEDEYLLAVNKPSGLQVLPGGLFQQRTVLTQLQWRSMEVMDKNSLNNSCPTQPSPVHRLGRGTSGVLLCAKTKVAKSRLSLDLASGASSTTCCAPERRVVKIYRALVAGIVQRDEILINQPIGQVTYAGVINGLYVATPCGKLSQSKVVVLFRNFEYDCTLVEVEIFSGRPHQIRIHMAYIGHPLVGDPLYVSGGIPDPSAIGRTETLEDGKFSKDDGGYLKPANPVPGECGYHLHAYMLKVIHPNSGKPLEIIAACPSLLSVSQS